MTSKQEQDGPPSASEAVPDGQEQQRQQQQQARPPLLSLDHHHQSSFVPDAFLAARPAVVTIDPIQLDLTQSGPIIVEAPAGLATAQLHQILETAGVGQQQAAAAAAKATFQQGVKIKGSKGSLR